MAESTEVQALEKISTEVGESQIKIILSSQCIKAQTFLLDKLRKQAERQKEICSFVGSSNLKLQTEIKQAEFEIKSLIISHETIQLANTELKKELLLADAKKSEIVERVSKGEEKYENLWIESKQRYESIPFVQKLLQASNKLQTLDENLVALEKKHRSLINEVQTKKDALDNLDRNRIIQLADYLINTVPKTTKAIQEKKHAINEISKEVDCIMKVRDSSKGEQCNPSSKKQTEKSNETKTTKLDEEWINISTNNERDTIINMPRLQFMNSDFDALNARLDQIKIMKVEIMNTASLKRMNPTDLCSVSNKKIRDDEFSIFFGNHNKINNNGPENEKMNDACSRRKLINILDDVKLDESDTYNIVSKISVENLRGVNMIGKSSKNVEQYSEESDQKENEVIEEIDLTKPIIDENNSNVLIPPTQFLDLSQDKIFSNSQKVEVIVHMSVSEPSSGMNQSLKSSQESLSKKRVSFDVPLSIQEITDKSIEGQDEQNNNNDDGKANETADSQVDISLASNESYSKIKDMILKKHNLDLSPQFTYAKTKTFPLNTDDTVTTSKFFQPNNIIDYDNANTEKYAIKQNQKQLDTIETENEEDMNVDEIIVSSPKASQKMKTDRSVTGLLFNHSTQGIPDSLNVSISTTGFDEGDADFPHCIDSSLLLSPKADLPMPMSGDNIQVTSQEVPNFLSGLRKTGLSFFGQSAVTESKPGTSDCSEQNPGNNFNFNFGGGEQKRGGLFSMFR